jgi:hypothetical protein
VSALRISACLVWFFAVFYTFLCSEFLYGFACLYFDKKMFESEFVSRFGCEEKCLGSVYTRCTSRVIEGILTMVDTFCIGLFGLGLCGTCFV